MKTPALVPDWRDSWKWYSQIGVTTIGTLSAIALAFGENPMTLKIVLACNVAAAALTGFGRIVEQTRRPVKPELDEHELLEGAGHD